MVPLADIFNHKVSVVELDPAYQVHGMADSDSEEEDDRTGSAGGPGGGGSSSSEEVEGEGEKEGREGRSGGEASSGGGSSSSEEGEGVESSGHQTASSADASGHACNGHTGRGGAAHVHAEAGTANGHQRTTAKPMNGAAGLPAVMSSGEHSRLGLAEANGLHLGLEMAIVDKEEVLQIVAASAVPTGAEVHNTYGGARGGECLAEGRAGLYRRERASCSAWLHVGHACIGAPAASPVKEAMWRLEGFGS